MTTVYNSGPTNLQQGNTANFAVEFLDASGSITVPSTGNLSISYTDLTGVTTTELVSLTLSNSLFTGSWSSTSAALGLANWSVTAAGSTIAQSVGQLRIIQRQGG